MTSLEHIYELCDELQSIEFSKNKELKKKLKDLKDFVNLCRKGKSFSVSDNIVDSIEKRVEKIEEIIINLSPADLEDWGEDAGWIIQDIFKHCNNHYHEPVDSESNVIVDEYLTSDEFYEYAETVDFD